MIIDTVKLSDKTEVRQTELNIHYHALYGYYPQSQTRNSAYVIIVLICCKLLIKQVCKQLRHTII